MEYIQLKCKDKKLLGKVWQLHLTDKEVTLIDHHGETVSTFSSKVAEKRILLPSFWESITDICIRLSEEEVISFFPNKKSIKLVKDYFAKSITIQGPQAIKVLKNQGRLHLFLGTGLVLVGVSIFSVLFVQYADVQGGIPRRLLYLGAGPLVYGLAELYRGIKSLSKYRNIQSTRSTS